jgi:deazaflavin-dependent oxidoreductase (nitroreductase family)
LTVCGNGTAAGHVEVIEGPRDAAAFRVLNKRVVEEIRAHAGRVGSALSGRDMLLLTTVGAKTGLPRLSPLVYFTIDDKMLIVGSFAGNDVAPGWVHNLRANPFAHVEVGIESYDVTGRELPGPERDAAYPKIVDIEPGFGVYEARTKRIIPLFELKRL